jgi:methylthioribose-1-phosphate isomerase
MDQGLKAIKYESGKLLVLDQLKLPHEFVYDDVSTCEEAFDCIKSMRVRGTFGNCFITERISG